MTADLSFYSGSAYLAAQTNGLIQITDFHNSDQTSIKTESPSVLYNYTLSQYYDCLGTQFIEPYDPRCRFWYQYAKNNEGIFIYEPYNDSLSGTLQMNLAQKILKDSKFYSVISIIFIMQNLMQLYGAQISRNSYSVLFHEFDISVFYHPLHIFNVPMTWVDVEFFNIKQFCNDSQETMTFCLSQKQLLLNQINQTIAFIKTGEYSIENKVNLDQLFQRWERFGQKEISVIFPIQSKLKGYNNQKPYSFAILLIAKVITDQTDQLKLFNLLDAKVFRVYLIVGFIILSIIILLFIINYGVFLVYQIQKPIKLLILFLKKSYQEQLTHQKLSKINKTESKIEQNKQKKIQQNKKSSIFQKINNKKTLNQKPLLNNNNNNNNLIFTYKNINYIQDQFYKQDNPPLLLQNQPSFNFQTKELSFQQFKGFDKCDDTQKSDIQFTKNNSQSPKIPTSFEITCLNIKQQQSNQVQSISFGQNHLNKENLQVISTPKITTEKSTFSIQNDEFIKLKEENKNQILQGLTPLFLEMKIIKQTFQDLESLINYSIDAQNYNSEDFTKSLFHFSKAKSTFQQLKNQIGLCRCYYNLGLASLLNNNYQLGQEYFESAIQLSFETIGINYQDLTNFKIFNKSQNNYVKQLQILTKKIFSKAYCLKQQALSFYYNDQNENFVSFSLLNRNFFKHNHDIQRIQQRNSSNVIVQLINQSLNTFGIVLRFVENNQSSFSDICKIHLYQEMIEIYIFLRQNNNKIFYKLIEKVNQIMNNQKYQDNIMSEPSYISYVNTYKQIIEIQKSRQLFLLGLIEQSKNNNIEAFELFTQSIEEGSHYSPNLRKKLKYHLRQIINDINDIPFKNMVFEAQKSFFQNKKTPIDLTIVTQLDYCKENYTIESILQNIQKTNLFEEQDRIQILIYHSEIDIFISYTVIQCSQDWNVIIDSLKDIERIIINDKMKTQLSWQEALFQSLQFINDLRPDDLVSLKQYFDQNQRAIQNNINERSHQNFLTNEIKKVILLFSNKQENDHAKLSQDQKNFQKIINNQKPIVYHLKESTSQNNKKEFNSPFISYEPLENENQIVSKLIQLRKEDHLNEGQEFISILYNF